MFSIGEMGFDFFVGCFIFFGVFWDFMFSSFGGKNCIFKGVLVRCLL